MPLWISIGRYGGPVPARRLRILPRFAARRHRRVGVAAAVTVAASALLLWSTAGVALAQEFVEAEGTDPRVTIDRVVIGLLLIATMLSLLTLGYVWHTQPQRRADAQERKAGQDEAATPGAD